VSGNGLSRPNVTAACNLVADLFGERVRLLGGQHPVRDESPAEGRHGVALLGGLVLLGSAELLDRLVLGEVQRHTGRGDDVAVRREAVHLRLDECWSISAARTRDGGADGLVHGHRRRPSIVTPAC